MVSRLGQSGSVIDSRRAHREFQQVIRCRLALGNDLFLWDLLVAGLSDDSLRAIPRVDRLPTSNFADRFRSALSCARLRPGVATDSALRRNDAPDGARCMGNFRLGPLPGRRATLECDWLFAGVSSNSDSASAVGWRLFDQRDASQRERFRLFIDFAT